MYCVKELSNMKTIVVYKTKYGSTKTYAEWIGEELSCRVFDISNITAEELETYDNIIYGGGLYAEVINGVSIITKNIDKLKNKKIAIYTTGITPLDCKEYYGKYVVEKNFKNGIPQCIKIFNFTGKMIIDELSTVHKAALKTLKKIMSSKKEPTEMEKLLVELCDANGDFCDRNQISGLIDYIKN